MAKSIEERFWAKVDKDGPVPSHRPELGPCWVWTAYCLPGGYGQFGVSSGHMVLAHRWIWEQENGPIPEGWELDHLCRTRNCVRVSHLELVKHVVNCRRGTAGDLQRAKTHCPQGHPYDATNTYAYKGGRYGVNRMCRECNRIRSRAWKAKRPRGERG